MCIEQRVDYSDYAPGGFGTADILIQAENYIEIIDFKYGKGVKVQAPNNSQLMLYGLGALKGCANPQDIEVVILTVYQPRIHNIDSWGIATELLTKWGEEVVKPKSQQAFKGEGDCVYGTHCDEGFCKARTLCKAYAMHHLNINKFSSRDTTLFTDEELYEIYEIANSYKKWVDDIKTYLVDKLLKGETIKGLKLIEGRGKRAFTSEDDVIEILDSIDIPREDFIQKKLISLTNLEKLLGKDKFNTLLGGHIHIIKGNPTLAKAEVDAPEYSSAIEDFKE